MMLFTWLQYATQGGAELGGQIRRGIAAPGTAGQRNQSSGGGADHGRAAGFQRKCRVYFAGSLQTDQHLVYNGSQLAAAIFRTGRLTTPSTSTSMTATRMVKGFLTLYFGIG